MNFQTLSNPIKTTLRVGAFVATTLLIWAAYFWWRPPGPTLFLRTVAHMPEANNEIALTFDDGPHPLTTPLLLAALKRADVKASFFVVRDGLILYPQLAKEIADDGHRFANHSSHHINLTRIERADYPIEIDRTFEAISNAGQDTRLFRPPGGGLDRRAMNYLYDHDVTLAWWTNNVGDWAPLPAWKIAAHMQNTLRAGDIVLMHDAGTSTPQAIPIIVREARKKGLQFAPMPESVSLYDSQ